MITVKKLISKKTGKPFVMASVTNVYGKDLIVTFDSEIICLLAECDTIADLYAILDANNGSINLYINH